MKSVSRLFPLSLLAVAGCSSAAPALSDAELQAELDKLAAHCNVPKSILQAQGDLVAVGGEDLADIPYERVECVFDGLKARGLGSKMGFIGNEAYK